MKHIQIFESFVSEAAPPFDPLKFKVAAELISKKIGQEQKTTLTFPEIKESCGLGEPCSYPRAAGQADPEAR